MFLGGAVGWFGWLHTRILRGMEAQFYLLNNNVNKDLLFILLYLSILSVTVYHFM